MRIRKIKQCFAILSLFLWLVACGRENPVLLDISEEMESSEDTMALPTEHIYVYVCGQVETPGVYELESGKRINDAVTAAGGLKEEADFDALNLAAFLTDGQKVYVPSKGEEGSDLTEIFSGKVDINHADEKELCTLSGIGESRAKEIIAYREKNGAFTSTEDLLKVSGIKQNVYDKIKDDIEVR